MRAHLRTHGLNGQDQTIKAVVSGQLVWASFPPSRTPASPWTTNQLDEASAASFAVGSPAQSVRSCHARVAESFAASSTQALAPIIAIIMHLTPAPVRALLVDDDSSIRSVIARLLTRRFNVHVSECENGMQALEALSSERFSFVLLDLDMPTLDGIQVLQAIRETPSLSHLPVTILSGCDEQETVHRVVHYGVTGYIVKPILPGELHERFSVLLSAIRRQEPASATSTLGGGFQPLSLSEEKPVLIADGSAEFRQFFARTVGHLYQVEEASSGIAAMKRCLTENPPHAVFIGSDLGLMKGETLARNLSTSGIRVIGVQPPRLGLRPKKASPYEVVIVRSFVPEVFTEGFNSLLLRRGPMSGLRTIIPDLNLVGIAATEQAISSALNLPLVLRPVKPTTGRTWTASMTLEVGSDSTPMRLQLSTPDRCISKLADRLELEEGAAGNAAQRVLPPLVARVCELLGRELEARGIPVAAAHSADVRSASRKGPHEHAGPEVIAFAFDVQRAGISFRLEIGAGEERADQPVPEALTEAAPASPTG